MALDLEDLLDELEDWLEESKGTGGVNGAQGQLSEPNKSYVETRLDRVEDHIETLRDPQQSPSLSPPNIGNVLDGYDPQTTAQYANACHTLSQEAEAEATQSSPNHQYIGDRIATISSLLPGYRTAAGL